MAITAARQMRIFLPRLAAWIKESGQSMRGICRMTEDLEAPEKISHGNLSVALAGKGKANLYFQQVVLLCNALGMPPAALFLDTDNAREAKDAVTLANAYIKLPEARRSHLLASILSEAKAAK